jgi:hypothetical protein
MDAKPLKVHLHENHNHHDLRRRGRDRHLPEPNRGPHPISRPNLPAGCDLTKTQPTDLVNQSIPFSYFSVEVAANDGGPHEVQLYTDVSGEWLAPSDQEFEWQTTTNGTISHLFWLKNQTRLTEVGGRDRDGAVVYSTKQVAHSHEILLGSFSEHFRSAE